VPFDQPFGFVRIRDAFHPRPSASSCARDPVVDLAAGAAGVFSPWAFEIYSLLLAPSAATFREKVNFRR
jgi:hypothetical protein